MSIIAKATSECSTNYLLSDEVSCLSDGRELLGRETNYIAEVWSAIENETHQIFLQATVRWLILIKGTQMAPTSAFMT